MGNTIELPTAPKINIERLKQLATTNWCVRALLNYAAKQPDVRGNAKLTVDSLHGILKAEEMTVVSRRKLTATLRVLAQTGCGRFFTGRHGQPSRFAWAFPLGRLANMVHGNTANPPERSPAKPAELNLCAHSFRLRQDLTVSLNLPSDLSTREAERLARFIQALPLREG